MQFAPSTSDVQVVRGPGMADDSWDIVAFSFDVMNQPWALPCGRLHRRAAILIECVQAYPGPSKMAEAEGKYNMPKRITTPISHPRRARDMKAELDHRGARSSNGDPNNWNTSKIITSRTLNSRRKIHV